MRQRPIRLGASVAAGVIAGAFELEAATLVINANTSDPAPRAAFEAMVEKFQAENPDVEVELKVFDHEGFKPAIRLFLMFDAPDVVTWFAGERMRGFVERGLFADLSGFWQTHGLDRAMAASRGSVTVDGKQWGVPYTHYQWGVYYRKDLFEEHGLAPPATWDEFLQVCATLKDAGITPITIGTRFLWPAAGWFDYLDLRLNGLDFHLDLMAGGIAYTDPRVRKVFETWRPLLDNGYFIEDHASLSFQDALPPLLDGRAAMYLLGNFVVPFLEEAGAVDRIGFFRFPIIDPAVPPYEDAPTDTLHIPAGARNKADAEKFLAFVARPDNQAELNRILGQLPTHRDAAIPERPFLEDGLRMLQEAAGLAQFYDRDTTPEMAQIGMLGFRKFMADPDRLDEILKRLEIERRRIFQIYRLPAADTGGAAGPGNRRQGDT